MGRHLGLVGAALCALAGVAQAQVLQTDAAMTPLPQAVGSAEWSLVTDAWAYQRSTQVLYDPDGNDVSDFEYTFGDFYPTFEDGDAITLEGLFKWRGEDIDAVADATTAPGAFVPAGGISAELVLLGGNCQVALGWYNVSDEVSSAPPAEDEIYELIPANLSQVYDCQPPLGDTGFCPLAWDNVNPRELNRELWTPVAFNEPALLEDPRYTGGAIGFAVIGDPDSYCSANKYSVYAHNQKNSQGQPWVTALVYASTASPGSFYLAFEDLPMSAADWQLTGVPGNNARNDGDFNDMVYFVSVHGTAGTGGSTSAGSGGSASGSGGSASGSGGSASGSGGSAGGGGGAPNGSGGSGGLELPASSASTTSTAVGSGGDGSSVGGSGATQSEGGMSAAAGAPGDLACVPGRQLECSCSDGRRGAQLCRDDGAGFSACDCSGPAASDEGGCGCRLQAGRGEAILWGPALLLLGCGVWRRRSRGE